MSSIFRSLIDEAQIFGGLIWNSLPHTNTGVSAVNKHFQVVQEAFSALEPSHPLYFQFFVVEQHGRHCCSVLRARRASPNRRPGELRGAQGGDHTAAHGCCNKEWYIPANLTLLQLRGCPDGSTVLSEVDLHQSCLYQLGAHSTLGEEDGNVKASHAQCGCASH